VSLSPSLPSPPPSLPFPPLPRQDDLIFSVPTSRVICRHAAENHPDKRLRAIYRSVRKDEDLLPLFLMREKSMGKKSLWAAYIAVLPKKIPLPVSFDEDELSAIQVRGQGEREREREKR
jgi:hypothetical protein